MGAARLTDGTTPVRSTPMDDVPVFHNRLTSFLLATSFVAATTVLTIGLLKIWAYSHPNNRIAHGFGTIIG